jgi:hypothetical protein
LDGALDAHLRAAAATEAALIAEVSFLDDGYLIALMSDLIAEVSFLDDGYLIALMAT